MRFIVALCSKCFLFSRIVALGFIIKTIDINDCSTPCLVTSSARNRILKVRKQILWNPDFTNLQGERKLVRKFEKSGVKLQCLTEEGK